jgi:hypothetical protein
MSAIRELLSDLIDYAGLFPPAGLDMRSAARNYNAYKSGEYGWALGRFVVPATRLDELYTFGEAPARLAVLGVPDEPIPNIETFELKIAQPSEIEAAMLRLPAGAIAYFENENSDNFVSILSRHRVRAKIRTGGITESAFLCPRDLIRFIANCKRACVAWKATAGLHHPFRGIYRLTYEPDSPSCTMHGFVNVLLAAAMLNTDGSEDQARAILEETSTDAFTFSDAAVCWGSVSFSTTQIRDARQNFAISFGSCSFEEPIADLKALGWL